MNKEYRIKAKSPEHRKAIIGALEGLGSIVLGNAGNVLNGGGPSFESTPFVFFEDNSVGVDSNVIAGQPTHTSLDEMIDDIIRDRETVSIRISEAQAVVSSENIAFTSDVLLLRMTHQELDQIHEASKKVRGQ